MKWRGVWVCLAAAGVLSLAVVSAQWPGPIDLPSRLESPSWQHPFGTDELGRDVFLRLAAGALHSLRIGLVVVSMAAVAGVAVGCGAGFAGGATDRALVSLMDLSTAFPALLLALALVCALGSSTPAVVIALTAACWVGPARLARSQTLSIRTAGFLDAQRAIGSPWPRILLRHILPNVAAPILAQLVLDLPLVVLAEGTLGFLGLGAPPPAPGWGTLIDEGRRHLIDAPTLLVLPGLALLAGLVAISVAGQRLTDRFDPRRSAE